jgi:hypothetical protein
MSAEETANATAGATEVAPEDEGFRVSGISKLFTTIRVSEDLRRVETTELIA